MNDRLPVEPVQPGWPVTEIERLIGRCGLTVAAHPARADPEQRYFAERADDLRPYTVETLVTARVAGAERALSRQPGLVF